MATSWLQRALWLCLRPPVSSGPLGTAWNPSEGSVSNANQCLATGAQGPRGGGGAPESPTQISAWQQELTVVGVEEVHHYLVDLKQIQPSIATDWN